MLLVVNFLRFPFSSAISFTNLDEIIWFSTSDIKKIVSILLFSFLFIPANWNSYSKSETALNPRSIILDLYFLQILVVNELKEITLILFLLNFKSENKAYLTILILSSTVKR